MCIRDRQQRKAFIQREITKDLARSRDWGHVIRKARAYRFALFKEQAKRKAKQYDRNIKNIKMKQALAIHNMEFKVDPPLITDSDITTMVGDLGKNIKGTMAIQDGPLYRGAENVGGIPIDAQGAQGVRAFPEGAAAVPNAPPLADIPDEAEFEMNVLN